MTTSKLYRIALTALLANALTASAALADDAGASSSVSLDDAAASSTVDSTPSDQGPPWGVAPGQWEVGLFWGVFHPNKNHELYDGDGDDRQALEKFTPELGLRGGYYPLRVLGFELEAGLLPSQTAVSGDGVNVWALRGHAVLLAPTKAVVPFLTVGGGALGVVSEPEVLGSDVDGTFNVGVGAKAFVTDGLTVRLDLRDNFTGGRGTRNVQHFEALLGLSVVSGRPKPPPPDADHDGVLDANDKCPTTVGPAPDGCPPPPDSDGDGIVDRDDKCPLVAGVDSADLGKRGCPLPPPPPPDGDGDGVPDASDKCPTEAGDGPDGCLADSDADGIMNRDDKCPAEAETKNGFDDTDGCPDELPQEVKAFTGAIQGIAFAANKATVQPSSFPTLDSAAKVLTDYPTLRVEISGHTDSSGKAERNLELSGQRADAVKAYLVSKGVTTERITTRGAGSNEPVGDNKTKEGRAQNRRIEFKLLQ